MKKEQLLERLEKAWTTLQESYTGLTDPQLMEPGVIGDWSVKDILAHVTSLRGGGALVCTADPQRRQATTIHQVWGIDAFNARMAEQNRAMELSDVLRQLDETHHRLIEYLQSVPEEHFKQETPFRHRLRLDTYSHYHLHAGAIQEWLVE